MSNFDIEDMPTVEKIRVRVIGPDGEVVLSEDVDMEKYEKFCGKAARLGISVEQLFNKLLDEWLDAQGV